MDTPTDAREKKQPRVLFAIFLLFFGGMLLVGGIRGLVDDKQRVVTPRGTIHAEFVTTPELQRLGLSGREEISRDDGMMFVFDNETTERCFWMKGMNFAIDMIWLDADKKVVFIKENATPETYPESFCTDEPAQYVLEVVTGRAAQLGIEEGVELRF